MTITQDRVAAVAAALFGVFLLMTVATVDVPHDAGEAELIAWWQSSGNRWSGVFSGLAAIGAATTLAVVRHHLGTLRTGVLARWVGRVGLGCAAVMLVGVVAQYGSFTTPLGILWAMCLAVALWRDPGALPVDDVELSPQRAR